MVAILIVASTWTQVTAPQLIGQSVDCYLMPAAAERLTAGAPASMSFLQGGGSAGASTNCTYTTVDPAATAEENIAGLGGLILKVLGLYIGGALVTGLMFFMMTWAGQRVLRSLRVEVFRHLHRLSLTYYAENEAGSVMSRITNDTETIAAGDQLHAGECAQRRAAAGLDR